MGNLMYIFYLSKVLDFCDTFFIVMGKKWKQLSVLHVYHHVTVFFVSLFLLDSPCCVHSGAFRTNCVYG